MLQSNNQIRSARVDSRGQACTDRLQLTTEPIDGMTFSVALEAAMSVRRVSQQRYAEAMEITPGYFGKFMRAVGEEWARRLVAYMRETRSLAPLQWLADRVDCDVVPRSIVAWAAWLWYAYQQCRG